MATGDFTGGFCAGRRGADGARRLASAAAEPAGLRLRWQYDLLHRRGAGDWWMDRNECHRDDSMLGTMGSVRRRRVVGPGLRVRGCYEEWKCL